MPASSTVRVSKAARDAVKALAETDGVTFDEEIRRLARAERQRRMGEELARWEPDEDNQRWLDMSVATMREHARW